MDVVVDGHFGTPSSFMSNPTPSNPSNSNNKKPRTAESRTKKRDAAAKGKPSRAELTKNFIEAMTSTTRKQEELILKEIQREDVTLATDPYSINVCVATLEKITGISDEQFAKALSLL